MVVVSLRQRLGSLFHYLKKMSLTEITPTDHHQHDPNTTGSSDFEVSDFESLIGGPTISDFESLIYLAIRVVLNGPARSTVKSARHEGQQVVSARGPHRAMPGPRLRPTVSGTAWLVKSGMMRPDRWPVKPMVAGPTWHDPCGPIN